MQIKLTTGRIVRVRVTDPASTADQADLLTPEEARQIADAIHWCADNLDKITPHLTLASDQVSSEAIEARKVRAGGEATP